MGKKKVLSEEEIKDMMLPVANDVLGIAVKLLGFDRVLVKCQDGRESLCRIRGKKDVCGFEKATLFSFLHGTSSLTNVETLSGVTLEVKLNCLEKTDT